MTIIGGTSVEKLAVGREDTTCKTLGIPQCAFPAGTWKPGACQMDGCPRQAAHQRRLNEEKAARG